MPHDLFSALDGKVIFGIIPLLLYIGVTDNVFIKG